MGTTTTTTALATFRVRASYGTGKVHVASNSRLRHHHVLACSGRSVEGCVPTNDAVTCGSCLRRFHDDLEALGLAATCTIPFATGGTCGKPSVVRFRGLDGPYGECADHAPRTAHVAPELMLRTGACVHVVLRDGLFPCVERFVTGRVIDHPTGAGWAAWTRSGDCRTATMISDETEWHFAEDCPISTEEREAAAFAAIEKILDEEESR